LRPGLLTHVQEEPCVRRCTRETAPPERDPYMTNETVEPPAMREGDCPYCERTVLVYEEPPRCPLCACPLDEQGMHPYVFPSGESAPDAE
jgi:hypothetical protein